MPSCMAASDGERPSITMGCDSRNGGSARPCPCPCPCPCLIKRLPRPPSFHPGPKWSRPVSHRGTGTGRGRGTGKGERFARWAIPLAADQLLAAAVRGQVLETGQQGGVELNHAGVVGHWDAFVEAVEA